MPLLLIIQQGSIRETGTVNEKRAEPEACSNTTLSMTNDQVWDSKDAQVQEAVVLYPVNASFGSTSPDSYFLTDFEVYLQSLSQFGENGCHAGERMIGRYLSKAFGSGRAQTYRFDAPSKA